MEASIEETFDNPLDTLVFQKEREWKDAFKLRVQSLEKSLTAKEKELRKEKLRFHKLKEDFEYNLNLIEERDKELDRYEEVFGKVKETESTKAAEISELLVKIDELKIKLDNEAQAKEELQKHYQKRLKEYQNEMNCFRQVKENEINKEREELTSYRRNLESQLREAEDDYEFRRQELVGNFDEMMRKREQEYQRKVDETSGVLLANDLKIRTLVKELELVRCASGRCKEELEQKEGSSRELEKELKEKEWMISDMENTHNFQMADKNAEIENMEKLHSKLKEDFIRKYNEKDRVVKEREEMLVNAKQGFADQERKLLQNLRELHSELEKKDHEYRQKEWKSTDKMKEQDITIQRFQETIEDLKDKLEGETKRMSENIVIKDVELETLQQHEGKLRSELAQKKDELARRQKELTLSLERESALERSKAQLEVDWQRRCEDAERSGYEKQEELVRSLTKTKEEAHSLVNEQKRELAHKDSLIRILAAQRDESIATLKRHGLSVPQQLPTKDNPEVVVDIFPADIDTIKDLQSQNDNLLQIIHQMRQDMENLTTQLTSHQSQTTNEEQTRNKKDAPVTPEYVESLEKEVRDLKAKNRDLVHSLPDKVPVKTTMPGKPNELYMIGHVKELNDTIGVLRQEKLEVSSQLRKCEATVAHLQGIIARSSEEVRQKQSVIDKLKYQLSSVSRRADDEFTSLKQREADLSLQLAQARQEADEFYKNSLERNIDAVALGNQLSELKFDLASQGNLTSSYNPQSHVIRQLQDEVHTLRNQLKKETSLEKNDKVPSGKVSLLQNKLRDAAKRINVLVQEKEQLINIGNKLRAEITKLKGNSKPSTALENVAPTSQSPTSKLHTLEQLQYQLTARELQYVQKGLGPQSRTRPLDDNAGTAHVTHTSVAEKPESVTGPGDKARLNSSRDDVTPWRPSFSSDDHSSLKEVWKLLDDESPGITPREVEVSGHLISDHVATSMSSSGGFTVKGRHSNLQLKPAAHKRPLSTKTAGKWRPAIHQQTKIRNYNIKDNNI